MSTALQRLSNSIRLELGLIVALAVGACGLVLGVATTLWLRASLEHEVEAFVLHEADEVAHVAAEAGSLAELQAREILFTGLFPEEGVVAVELWTLDGEFLIGRPEYEPRLGDWPAGLERARHGERPLEEIELSGRPLLRTARRVEHEGDPRWIAVAAVWNDRAEPALVRFVEIYLLGLAVVMLLAFGGSVVLVRRALRAVQVMVDDASLIASEGPQRRLAVPGEGSELRELALLLNGMLARIAANVEQLRRFTAHAGHELRTPLTRIRGEAELALLAEDPAGQRERLESILEETEGLRHVVDGLLEQAHGEPLDLSGEAPFALEGVVAELAEQATVLGSERGVAVTSACEPGLRLRASKPLLNRAIWNLLDNALKYATRAIEVTCVEEDDWVLVRVADDGSGVKGDREAVFEAFHTGEAPPELKGYGLGLALSRTIARRHGGDLVLVAAQGPGACFELRLPGAARSERQTGRTPRT